MPLVSVVTTAYNVEDYIKDAIESILNQTFQDFEFIIIDDCSTDNTYSIIQKYAQIDKRIQVYQNKTNLKLPTSLNLGIKYAKGKYIARFDSDDIAALNRLERQVKFLDMHPDIEVVGSAAIQFYDNTKNMVGYHDVLVEHSDIKSWLFLYGNIMIHPSIMLCSFTIKKYLYNIDLLNAAEDYDLWDRMLSDGVKFSNLKQPLIYYRTHQGQLTNINKQNIDLHARQIITNKLNLLLNDELDKESIIKNHFDLFLAPFSIKTILNWCKYNKHMNQLLTANLRSQLLSQESLKRILNKRSIMNRIYHKIFVR